MTTNNSGSAPTLNVLGEPLQICSCEPLTGWYRDGFCKTDNSDIGQHTVCCVMTQSFLTYSKAQGNDLITAMLEYGFSGLKPGDHWCLCAPRWKEAYLDGMAPLVRIKATAIGSLDTIELELLKEHAFTES